MDHAINDIKQRLYATVSMYKDNPNDETLQADILALIKAINVLELHAYGRTITDEWGLVD